ncbi:MAG: c-type cytochrome [Flavobacteriales bacterium]|nr:c-type cytochrome [Flavobacteriales bacterium]
MHTITLGALATATVLLLLSSCGRDPNSPGVEYMPDMYRSPAIEAYVDFGQDPYHYGEDLAREQRERPSARRPADGTIPFAADPAKAEFMMPYPYPNTPDGYEQAGRELKSPVAMTEATVEKGKVIYGKFCQHCHGEKGQGDGPAVQRSNDKYPQPPAYDGAQLKELPEGKMYHTLTHGKGAMGSHASQLDKEERWLVVQYVKYLQAGGQMPGAMAAN